MICKLPQSSCFNKKNYRATSDRTGDKRGYGEETAAEKRGNVRGGNQINVTPWVKVRAVRLTEPDSSSYTKSGKTPHLSKPDIFTDYLTALLRVLEEINTKLRNVPNI